MKKQTFVFSTVLAFLWAHVSFGSMALEKRSAMGELAKKAAQKGRQVFGMKAKKESTSLDLTRINCGDAVKNQVLRNMYAAYQRGPTCHAQRIADAINLNADMGAVRVGFFRESEYVAPNEASRKIMEDEIGVLSFDNLPGMSEKDSPQDFRRKLIGFMSQRGVESHISISDSEVSTSNVYDKINRMIQKPGENFINEYVRTVFCSEHTPALLPRAFFYDYRTKWD